MNINYFEDSVIVVSTEVIHKLFEHEHWADLVALYMFYHKQCKIQKTNQSFTTAKFAKKWLGWWKVRYTRAKKILEDMGYIEDVCDRDEEWKIKGWYVKLNYIMTKDKPSSSRGSKTHPVDSSTSGWQETNAWSSKIINAWSSKKVNAWDSEKEQIPYKKIIKHFNKTADRSFNYKTQTYRDKIKARRNEWYKLDDFLEVHKYLYDEWTGTKYEKYLRPSTIYRKSKFPKYVDDYKYEKKKKEKTSSQKRKKKKKSLAKKEKKNTVSREQAKNILNSKTNT